MRTNHGLIFKYDDSGSGFHDAIKPAYSRSHDDSIAMKVCLFRPGLDRYSETFIRAHKEKLPCEVVEVRGYDLPGFLEDGASLMTEVLAIQWLLWRLRNRLPRFMTSFAASVPEKALASFLVRRKIDVMLAEYGMTGTLVAAACSRAGVPLVVHFHGYDAYAKKPIEQNSAYRTVFASAARVVAVSEAMKKQLCSLGCDEAKVSVIPCGADLSLFSQPARPDLAPPHFLSIGRFVDKKAPQLTILAFARVAVESPESRLTMVGDGPLLDCCIELTAGLGLQNRIEFLGSLPHERVAQLLYKSRAFVQHSIRPPSGDSEGTPVAILEAAAAGLPVVATKHAGIPDVVICGETGFLVEERDVRGMADCITTLARDPRMAACMGTAGRTFVSSRLSQAATIHKLERVLKDAASKRARSQER